VTAAALIAFLIHCCGRHDFVTQSCLPWGLIFWSPGVLFTWVFDGIWQMGAIRWGCIPAGYGWLLTGSCRSRGHHVPGQALAGHDIRRNGSGRWDWPPRFLSERRRYSGLALRAITSSGHLANASLVRAPSRGGVTGRAGALRPGLAAERALIASDASGTFCASYRAAGHSARHHHIPIRRSKIGPERPSRE